VTRLTFVEPPLGLAPLTDFTLEQLEGPDGLFALQSVDDPARRMFLLDPAALFVIANHREGTTTVNLLAPIVVNKTTNMCAQFILEGQDWPIQAPLSAP
jgi:flagellar assembly factor FliW